MPAALQVWSNVFSGTFDNLPPQVQRDIMRKVDAMGNRLETFAHQRLKGRPEYKLRVGNYRVLYEFNATGGRIFLHFVGHRRDIYKRS